MNVGIGTFIIAFLASFITTFWLRHHALRLGLLDVPNARSSHSAPTPRGGGLAIALVNLVGLLALAWWTTSHEWKLVFVYTTLGGLIAALGLVDDWRSLSARIRLIAQMTLAALAIAGFGYITEVWLPFVGPVRFGWLGIPLTFLWIVGLTNAYNFMDGIDGLAAGQAVVAGLLWTIAGWGTPLTLVAILGLLTAAASLGFLFHNWSPARIFMGDVASGFLGFTFAILPLLAMRTGQQGDRSLVAGTVFVGVFIFDAGLTFIRRLLRGENVLEAHRSHLYQRLVRAGYSHRAVTTLYLMLAVVLGGCGLVYLRADEWTSVFALAMALLLLLALFLGVTIVEMRRPAS